MSARLRSGERYRRLLIDANAFARAAFDPRHPGAMAHRVVQRVLTLMEDQPVVLAWDHRPTRRLERFPGYKQKRYQRVWPDRDQFNKERRALFDLLRMMAVPQAWSPGWEADDVLATLAVTVEGLTQVQTRDEDLLQTVGADNHVLLVKGSKHRLYDERTFVRERGFEPARIVDFKALAGDASDSVPGVKGVGKKAATEIVSAYPEAIEHIVSGAGLAMSEMDPNALSKRASNLLFRAAEDPKHVELMRWVVTCRTDVPVSWVRPVEDPRRLKATLSKMGLRVVARRLGMEV